MSLKSNLATIILPFSILILYLFQIYAQYSTLITARTKDDNENDGRNSMFHYELSKTKQYDFNINKVNENFNDNVLMNVGFFKKMIEHFFESLNKEEKVDTRFYMLYYLFLYDLIVLIIVYIFIYGSFKAGCVKTIIQIFRIYFNTKRMQHFNKKINVFQIILNKMENNFKMRGWSFFNPEGFFVIEYLCNIIVILDILFLLVLFLQNRKSKKIINDNLNVDDLNEDNKFAIENDSNSDENNSDNGKNKYSRGDSGIVPLKLLDNNDTSDVDISNISSEK